MLCRPYFKRRSSIIAHAGGQSFTPPQIAKIYGFPTGLDGTGQTVGVIELGGGFVQADLDKYFKALGLSVKPVIAVGIQGAHNSPGQDADGEVMLDLCVIGGIAPGAQMRCYFAPNTTSGFAGAIQQAVTDGCSVISISWGGPEDSWDSSSIAQMQHAFAAAKAANVTVCAASGDNGSSDGESGNHCDYPASDPSVLGCGGTSLAANNGQRTSEVVWNDGTQGGATGGGLSNVFAQPPWQLGSPGTMRAVPDVAGNADPQTGWQVVVDGQSAVIGGTSAVAPMWAGLVALLNQGLGKRAGFINPALYALNAGQFFDVTSGNNGTFMAKPGYDCCTGLGVPIGALLLAALGGTVAPPVTPPPVTPPPVTPPPIFPGPTVLQEVDAVFAALEKRYAGRRLIVAYLKIANQIADAYIKAHPTQFPAGASLTQIFNTLFAGWTKSVPAQYQFLLQMVEQIIDGYLAMIQAKVAA